MNHVHTSTMPQAALPAGLGYDNGNGDAHGGGHGGGPELFAPERNDPRFLEGSTGPVVGKDDAPKIDIPDGEGFGGIEGRKQNDGDRKQNRYSTTDANFYPTLGLLPANPDTGEEMNYVQHIQAYNAAGYVATYAPEAYAQLVANQNAGQGTVLGGALYLMGVVQRPDPAAAGLNPGMVPQTVPGTPLNARDVVMSGEDMTGQDWARPHHAESSWGVFKQLMDAGVDWKSAGILSGDDAVSGSGRLNGFNNQDGNTGLNADERAVYRLGAQVQASTGVNVIGIMAGGHSHTGLDESAKTDPKINKLIGLPKDDRSSSPQRIALITQALLDGTVGGDHKTLDEIDKFKGKAEGAYTAVQGTTGVIDQVRAAEEARHPEDNGGGDDGGNDGIATPYAGMSMPMMNHTMPPAGGATMDALGGATGVGAAGPPVTSLLRRLQQLIEELARMLSGLGAHLGASAGVTSAADGVGTLGGPGDVSDMSPEAGLDGAATGALALDDHAEPAPPATVPCG